MNRVEEFLQHFDALPYDPAKAHEYYLKNRNLKGRTTSGMTSTQKKAWSYSKDQVSDDKKTQMDRARLANAKKIEDLRERASELRARLSEKIQMLSERLSKRSGFQRNDLTAKMEADIAKIPPIPDGLSATQRAVLVEKRNKQIDAIRNTVSSDKAGLIEDTDASRRASRGKAMGERSKVSSDLKTAIAATRDSYAKAKEKFKADYEATYQKEYDKVLGTIAGKPKSKSKPKTETHASSKAKAKNNNNAKAKISNTRKSKSIAKANSKPNTATNKKNSRKISAPSKAKAEPKNKKGSLIYNARAKAAEDRRNGLR